MLIMTRVVKGLPVEVTEEVIADSIRRDSSHCMIAEAVRRAVPTATFVAVDLQTIRFTDKENRRRYVFLTPRRAQELLVKFDQGERPEPFRVRLSNPQVVELSPRKPNRDAKEDRGAAPKTAGAADGVIAPVAVPDPKPVKRVRKTAELKVRERDLPGKVGGDTPPTAVLSNRGRIRRFGLKSVNV
jgi:hypothetical protein